MKGRPLRFHIRNRHALCAILTLVVMPAALAAQAGEILYVGAGDCIVKVDLATKANLGIFANSTTGVAGPEALAFDQAGNLYVANYHNGGGNTILKITPAGVGSVFATAGVFGPAGLAFDRTGNLYVANYTGNTIEKFTPNGAGSLFATVDRPASLAFDQAGNLYAAYAGGIEKFTPGGVGSSFASMTSPMGLAFDRAGNLYASTGVNETILRFTPGGASSVFANTGMDFPAGLAFDSAGNLYAANWAGNNIDAFTPGGAGSVLVRIGPPAIPPWCLAVQVPEPSAGWLLALGLPAWVLGRRLRSSAGTAE